MKRKSSGRNTPTQTQGPASDIAEAVGLLRAARNNPEAFKEDSARLALTTRRPTARGRADPAAGNAGPSAEGGDGFHR